MKKRIYAIILITLLFITLITINCYARHYKLNSSNTETENDFWNGWKVFHYGATDIGSKKGDPITYKRKVINSNGTESEYETSVTTRGYGYYSFDFSKHILGLLTYLKNKITDYPTEYVPVKIIPDFDEYGFPKEPEAVKMRAAIEETINKLISNWYSNDYEIGEFANFWTKCIKDKVSEYGNELKTLQNKFYFEAYASNAINKLSNMMGSKYEDLSPNKKTALRGVVFSIMEARYRDKNLQGKRNLKLKVAEGDLWPFLVNITNLNQITRNKNSGSYEPAPEFPELDDIIDGAYQWMYYYDSQINHSTSHSTVTSYLNAQLEDEEELELDWESEYEELTDDDFPYLNTNRELEEFYTRCSIVRTLFKKSTENAEGIFGAEEIYDITSEVSFTEAMANMKRSMLSFADKAGKEIKDVFNGLTDYNIERTYLMAKNIVENENIQNEYAYYNIGTNVLTYTPGIDGDEYLLIDFQKVKLKKSLVKFNGNKREISEVDTDEDGILDRNELGEREEDPMFKKVNVTGFIKKMVEDELYGDDTEYKKTLINSADTRHYVYIKKREIDTALANIKYNIYTKRKEFLDTHDGIDNVKDRVELCEHYLNLDETTTNEISSMINKNDIINKLASNDAKLEVEVYKYRSNPVFKDTDFDGIDDKTETDNSFKPKNGLRKKDNVDAQVGESINIEDTMDYRYFYMSNKNYYDELARMSLIMSNAVSNGNGGVDTNEETKEMKFINTAMQSIGMTCEYSDVSKDNFIAGLAIGHNEVEYYNIKKNIVLIAISNARNVVEYSSFADIGKSDWSTTLNSNHSKAHEILANEVYNRINTYLTTKNISKEVVFWVTGYGTGGGIANLLSEKLIDNPPISTNIVIDKDKKFLIFTYGKEKVSMPTGMTNVYTYTFGAPNVVYTEDKNMGINNNKYKSIFNIVDASDVSAHMPTTATGWNKYGWNMVLTEKAEKCREVIGAYNEMMKNRTRDDIDKLYGNDTLTIKSLLEYIQSARANKDLTNNNTLFDGLNAIKTGTYQVFVNKYYAHYKELEPKHSIKHYYNLCNKLLPENMKVGDGWAERSKPDIVYSGMKDALDYMADWYLKNVYTYQVGSYGAKRYRTIYIPANKKDNILGYILQVNGDQIDATNIKINDYKNNMKPRDTFRVVYEQEISLAKAKTTLRKGIVQNDENRVTYYDGEQYQNEFKHRFEYYLDEAAQEARDNRETFFDTKDTENENEKNPELIYNFDSAYDVDTYMPYEKVERTKKVARGTYKFPYGNKTINVADDCSGFAGAVFYKFIKDYDKDKNININDIWYSSYYYSKGKATKLLDYGFKCYLVSNKENAEEDKNSLQYLLNNGGLQYGDLVCSNGHVEFYIGPGRSFGWGRTHSDYENEKYSYNWVWSDTYNCLYDSKLGEDNKDLKLSTNDKYVAVYRYEE